MAGIVGYTLQGRNEALSDNPRISSDLEAYTEVTPQFDFYGQSPSPQAPAPVFRGAKTEKWGIVGAALPSFKGDFYERIHLFPSRMDLGTVANNQTRILSVWNAHVGTPATLNALGLVNGMGITVEGASMPVPFAPMQERFWTVTITSDGPPAINAILSFDFDLPDPLPVVIRGSRATVLFVPPNVPVREQWKWLTNVQVAVKGDEQRIGLRGAPRVSQATEMVFVTVAEAREQYRLLLNALGRLFVPHFQWATALSSAAQAGTTYLLCDTGYLNARDGDFVLVIAPGIAQLLEVEDVFPDALELKAPLASGLPLGTRVVLVFPSLIPNNQSLSRKAVDSHATMSLESTAEYPRAQLQREFSTAELRYHAGIPILERQLIGDELTHTFDTGQEMEDGQVGLVEIINDWDYTKVGQNVTFRALRVGSDGFGLNGVQEFDYWRLFFDTIRGDLGVFFLPSHRPDQVTPGLVSEGSDSLLLMGGSYADDFWPHESYRYFAIDTAAGVHYATVTAASKNNLGDSTVTFTPALPSAPGWEQIRKVSYMYKLRMKGDTVDLEHYHLDTFISFPTRTVKE